MDAHSVLSAVLAGLILAVLLAISRQLRLRFKVYRDERAHVIAATRSLTGIPVKLTQLAADVARLGVETAGLAGSQANFAAAVEQRAQHQDARLNAQDERLLYMQDVLAELLAVNQRDRKGH